MNISRLTLGIVVVFMIVVVVLLVQIKSTVDNLSKSIVGDHFLSTDTVEKNVHNIKSVVDDIQMTVLRAGVIDSQLALDISKLERDVERIKVLCSGIPLLMR